MGRILLGLTWARHPSEGRTGGQREGGFARFPCIFPTEQGFRPQRRVRTRLPPPPLSLLLRRLRAFIYEQVEKFGRFRGVLAAEPRRIRTGDCGFGARKTR